MDKCWICGRTREEVNEYVGDGNWDKNNKTQGYLEIPSKDSNISIGWSLKKGLSIRVCDICWSLLQGSFEHELCKVQKAIQEAIPKDYGDKIVEQLEYYGFNRRYDP